MNYKNGCAPKVHDRVFIDVDRGMDVGDVKSIDAKKGTLIVKLSGAAGREVETVVARCITVQDFNAGKIKPPTVDEPPVLGPLANANEKPQPNDQQPE